MTFPSNYYGDLVQVAKYQGRGAKGDSYAPGVPVACYVDEDRKLVLGADGAETTSETTIYAAPETYSLFASGSLVTIGVSTAKVIAAHRRHHPLAPEMDHVEVALA